jgi:hypothetical protein
MDQLYHFRADPALVGHITRELVTVSDEAITHAHKLPANPLAIIAG